MIQLRRFCYGPTGTFGRLVLPDGFGCFTVEPPWQENRVGRSCIPEGVYDVHLRRSLVVERTSGGEFTDGWQVCDVPGRTHIMLHPGNTLKDTEGCVCPGQHLGFVDGAWAVTASRDTFRQLMRRLAAEKSWQIDIRHYVPEWP